MIKHDFQYQEISGLGEIYWYHQPEVESVRLGVIIWAGSMQDPKDKEGLAHLFEHLVFSGTAKFHGKQDVAAPIEEIGGRLNAYVDADHTVFYTEVPAADIKFGWEVLEEIVFHPLLRLEDLIYELPIIDAEISRAENHISRYDYIRKMKIFFGEEIGRCSWALGESKTLKNIQIDDLLSFHNYYYLHGHVTVIAVGNLQLLSDQFGSFISNKLQTAKENSQWLRQTHIPYVGKLPARWNSYKLPTKNPQILWSGPLHKTGTRIEDNMTSRYSPLTMIIANILTQRGMSSLLLRELREKRGLIYSIDSGTQFYDQNLGFWEIDAHLKNQVDSEKITDMMYQLLQDVNNFNDEAIETAKKSVLGNIALKPKTPKRIFNWAVGCLVSERRVLYASEWQGRIQSSDPEIIRQLIREAYCPANWLEIVYLPKE